MIKIIGDNMSKDKREYNLLSHKGFKDSDYVEEYKLDPALANTPELNTAIIDTMYNSNYQQTFEEEIGKGTEERRARQIALKDAEKDKAYALKNLKMMTKKRGY